MKSNQYLAVSVNTNRHILSFLKVEWQSCWIGLDHNVQVQRMKRPMSEYRGEAQTDTQFSLHAYFVL